MSKIFTPDDVIRHSNDVIIDRRPEPNYSPLLSFIDVLNVSGRFNSEELARDMTVGDDVKDEPFFDQGVATKAPQNVSALIGKTAFLTCVVRNLGKAKSVSDFFQ